MTVRSTLPFDLDGLLTLARTRREYLTQDDLDFLLDAIPVLIDHIVRNEEPQS